MVTQNTGCDFNNLLSFLENCYASEAYNVRSPFNSHAITLAMIHFVELVTAMAARQTNTTAMQRFSKMLTNATVMQRLSKMQANAM